MTLKPGTSVKATCDCHSGQIAKILCKRIKPSYSCKDYYDVEYEDGTLGVLGEDFMMVLPINMEPRNPLRIIELRRKLKTTRRRNMILRRKIATLEKELQKLQPIKGLFDLMDSINPKKGKQ